MLKQIDNLLLSEQNKLMVKLPTSASGLNSFSRHFSKLLEYHRERHHQHSQDFFPVVRDMQRYVGHTNLVLFPKKEIVTTFGDLRLNNLSTFFYQSDILGATQNNGSNLTSDHLQELDTFC